jgi:hypothetical protein
MSTLLDMNSDVRGYNAYAPAFSLDNQSTTLSANAEQHFTVPSNFAKWIAVFSYQPGSNVWVANNDTAAVPSSSFAATTSQFNPAARYVQAADVLSFITADTSALVGVSLYAIS